MESLGNSIEQEKNPEEALFSNFITFMNSHLENVTEVTGFDQRIELLQGIIEIMSLIEDNYDIEKFGIFQAMDFIEIKRKAEIMVFFSQKRRVLMGKVIVDNPMPVSINEWNT